MSERKKHWESVYQDKPSTSVSWYQPLPELSLRQINHSDVGKDEAIIDIGGGCSLLVDNLLEQGYTNLSVLDISATALDIARTRLGEAASRVNWMEADATSFELEQPISLWHDRAVFHFLTDPADRKAYINNLNQHLRTGGQLIIAAFSPQGPEKCSGLEIVQYDLDLIQKELGDNFHMIEATAESHITPSGAQQAFNYFRFEKMD